MASSENGFTTDELAYHWIHHFDIYSSKRQQSPYRLLLMDNHGSHLTLQFLEFCSEKRIIPFTFPPHLTHRLQPLDLIPFQQYKLHHGRAVNHAARMGAETFDKIDFLGAIENIRQRTFRSHIIKAGWRAAGIRPDRSAEVIREIRGRSSSPILEIWDGVDPNASEAPETPCCPVEPPKTPTTIRSLRRQVEQSINSKPELSPSIQRVFRGAIIQGEIGAQSQAELEEYLNYQQNKRKKKSTSKCYLKKQGVMYARDAIREVNEKQAAAARKEWKELKRRCAKERREILSRHENPPQSEPDLPEVPGVWYIDTRGVNCLY